MGEVIAAPVAVLRGGTPGLVGGKSLWNERGRLQRKGLGRRRDFAGNIAFRDGALFHGKDRLAGVAVQDVEKAGLVALDDDRDALAVEMQRGEQRWSGAVEVPKIMMDKLKAPDKLAGLAAQSDHGVGPLVVAGSQTTVVVRAGTSRRNEEQVAFLVDRHDGPGVASAAAPGS